MSEEFLTNTDIVFVKRVPYKPFWFGKHMYFVNLWSGELSSLTPIYLGCSEVASISQLKNYFQENDIEIIDGKAAT
jgi:hypothetical protein